MAATVARTFAASSTRSVLEAAEGLADALRRGGSDSEHALLRLESAARSSIDGLDEMAARGYDQPAQTDQSGGPPPTDDVLAVALGQLSVAAALTAVERAVEGDAAVGRSAELDTAVRGLRVATKTLTEPLRSEDRQGFDTSGVDSPTGEDVVPGVDACRAQVAATLDLLCAKAAGVVSESFGVVQRVAPEAVRDAIKALGEKLSLGGQGKRLLRLAVRALDRALTALLRLIPASALGRARDVVHELWERMAANDAMPAVMGTLFDVEGAREHSERVLRSDELDLQRLPRAKADLARLADRYSEHAALATGVVTGVAAVTTGLGLLNVAVPHLAAAAAGGLLLVVAVVALLGMDYADAGGLDRVRGVRSVLADLMPS